MKPENFRWRDLRSVVLALPVFLSAGAAAAEEPRRTGWIDGESTSSGCLGKSATPLCMVETELACRLRKDEALCRTVGLKPENILNSAAPTRPPTPNRHPAEVIEAVAVEYRVDDLDEREDTARIVIGARYHGKGGLVWPERGWRMLTYSLTREDGKAWRIEKLRWTPLVRWLGPVDAASRCIGDPGTPLCAVETHIACRVRSDDDICAAAGRVEAKVFRPHRATVLYYVDRIRRWEPPDSGAGDAPTVVVWMAESTEFSGPDTKPDSGAPYITRPNFVLTSYTVERRGMTWRVISRAERP